MQIAKNKITAIAIIVLLTLSMTALMTLSPTNAHSPAWNVPTYAFLAVSPNPVGVGQQAIVVFWLSQMPPTANGQYGDRWENMTVKVTSPDGKIVTLGPFESDPVGSGYTYFTPDATGNYTLQFFYGGQVLAGANPNPSSLGSSYNTSPFIGDYFEPSQSNPVTLVVQQERIESIPENPLPTGYWQTPINSMNTNWYTLNGNWLGTGGGYFGAAFYNASSQGVVGGNFNPYTTAPSSAHIIWTKPIAFGGMVGGDAGGTQTSSYYSGNNYENRLTPPIVINGYLYYNQPTSPFYGFYCLDLRTGKTMWYCNSTGDVKMNYWNNNPAYTGISCGQVYMYHSPNQYGGTPYLWGINNAADGSGVTYSMYSAQDGNWILNLVNASTGTIVMDSQGDMLVYVLNSANKWLAMWNSSLAIPLATKLAANGNWMWRPPMGATLNWLNGIEWNVTIPSVAGQSIKETDGNVLLTTAVPSSSGSIGYQTEIGYSAVDGSVLWGPLNRTLSMGSNFGVQGPVGDGIFTEWDPNTMTWSGYSLATGQKIWGPTPPLTNAWASYPVGQIIAYGCLYSLNLDGLHCYNVTTGEHLWDFADLPSGTETSYGLWPFDLGGLTVADGKVFIVSGHGHVEPLFRGAQLYCVDAYTGQELWTMLGWLSSSYCDPPIVACGSIVTYNAYDGQFYCFDKGLSATTVTTSPVINDNTKVQISGTVTDQSPGQTCLGIPAAGTPAISDADMSAWMAHLYEQQPEPLNATGVPVTLSYIDPNGNFYAIGNTTSDINGKYSCTFAPDVPGTYTILASFGGSNSYFSSKAETFMTFNSPAATPEPTSAPQSVADMYFVPAIAGLFVLIIVVAVVLALLMLRKRP